MTTGSNWFQDPAVLTSEIKRAHAPRGGVPVIQGYDELRELARGGQGIVYRGLQRSTRRQVAIKILLDGALASGVARRRFEREIDLVAGLKHPSIVSVYDSGATADGRLYLVMEFIDGVPLDAAVRSGEGGTMSVERTLALFAQVCDALQYAHQHGVIHRDLKPSNIRVDAAGLPHILDFGLAKAAHAEVPGAERSVLSISGQFMGSLPWASPEQASGDPDKADTRSDVYSLGVILYQLLTGRFPYDVASGLRSTLDNIIGAAPESASRFRPDVNDEIATILGRCLAKEPDRRYQSAGELATDLRLYLAGEPIQAKRDSAWYTVRKQLRRYRLAAAAAVCFVLLICAALVVSIALYRDASRERDKANRAADRSAAINGFLQDMLAAADPDKDGPKTPIGELLDEAAALIDTKFAGKDDIREGLHATLSDTYTKIGEYAKAEVHAQRVVELRRRLLGDEAPQTLSAIADLGMIVSKQQRPAEVEGELKRVLEIQRRTLGPYDQRTISTLTTLVQGLINRGNPAEAARLYEEVKDGLIAAQGADSESAMTVMSNLAAAYEDLSRLGEAEPVYRDVLERRRRISGPMHSETLTIVNNLATVLLRQNRLAEAEPLLKEQLAYYEKKLGDENINTLTAKNNYAKLLQDLGRFPEAEASMLAVLEGRRRVLGEGHQHTLITMNNLGTLYASMKRFEDSERVHRKVLALRTANLGPEHLDTIISTNNLAGTLRELGHLEEALTLYQTAVSVTDRTLPPGHNYNALFRMNLGHILFKLGRYDESETALLTAMGALRKGFGPAHPQTRKCAQNLVDLYEAWGKADQAEPFRAAAAAPAASK